jgi:retron-type reverse transcriptase
MQRVGNVWEGFLSFENLYRAWKRAFTSTKSPESYAFSFHLEKELFTLQEELASQTYIPGDYRYFTISDPKKRTISVARFRDRVVHHALVQVLEPIYEKRFIYHSYATRKGKGTHKAIEQARQYLKNNKWYLKMDISKYFDSIDHSVLKRILQRQIKDTNILDLCARIIAKGGDGQCGLPIGNLTSQFWANVYLDKFDHFIKDRLRVKAYLRYMNDFCLFSSDKQFLKDSLSVITQFLKTELRLEPKPRATLINTSLHGLPFLGARIWPSLIRIGQNNFKRSFNRLKQRETEYRTGKVPYKNYVCSMESLLSYLKRWNCKELMAKEIAKVCYD